MTMNGRLNLGRRAGLLALGVIAAAAMNGEAQARGAAPTLTAPGVCTMNSSSSVDSATSVQARLVKQNNAWVFGLTVVGPHSIGDWALAASKNGVLVTNPKDPLMSILPPGGWTAFLAATNAGDRGLVTFIGEATSQTGEHCTANIAIKP